MPEISKIEINDDPLRNVTNVVAFDTSNNACDKFTINGSSVNFMHSNIISDAPLNWYPYDTTGQPNQFVGPNITATPGIQFYPTNIPSQSTIVNNPPIPHIVDPVVAEKLAAMDIRFDVLQKLLLSMYKEILALREHLDRIPIDVGIPDEGTDSVG